MLFNLDWNRVYAVINKEFIQMRRDRLTFLMMVLLPLMQLILFGFAINGNPQHLPTVILNADESSLTRTFVSALQNTDYFKIINNNASEKQAFQMLSQGKTQFIVSIPVDFSRDFIRGHRPELLITADATDPTTTAYAVGALTTLANQVFQLDIQRGLTYLQPGQAPFNLIIHQQYNPEIKSQYNIVPGLIGVGLTMTMIMITCLAITRERERGTMENLLSTPVRPFEVMVGKIVPYIIVGYIQELLIIIASILIFNVPHQGSIFLLLIVTFPFIVANLSVGLTFSTMAKNQLQAVQMSYFYFLPSLLLSGFMFPFNGMPTWAQALGNIFPLTHFLVIVRGILLKGNTFSDIWPHIWPLLIFILFVLTLAVRRYKETLD